MSWSKSPVEHSQNGVARISVAFTWHLPQVYQRCVWMRSQGYHVRVGGPAVALMPDYLVDVAEVGGDWTDAVRRHNPDATFTSRGCVRRCSFCAVWRTEGELVELKGWPVRPIVCDNNLLACSRVHFDSVIDRLKPLKDIDFNQGLDARLLTDCHAARLLELDIRRGGLRLAFDHVRSERQFLTAFQRLRDAGAPKRLIRVYVLVGYNDTPEDALYRLRLVHGLGIEPNPMRYNPLDALVRDSYVGPNWTNSELIRHVRYWANLRWFGAVPFEDFR